MNLGGPTGSPHTRKPSEAGKARLLSRPAEPLFLADWDRALFLHFEVAPEHLQPHVPFPLDLFEDHRAFVSLVAFTMRNMRPRVGGRIAAAAFKPIATHPFLNVRTYVRHRDEPGIHFLIEWLPNRLACLLGPSIFGLPYRLGQLDYCHDHETGEFSGKVRDGDQTHLLEYENAENPGPMPVAKCRAGSLDEFLVERYTAFTARKKRRGFFRIWHEPWPLTTPQIRLIHNRLLAAVPGGKTWSSHAEFVGAHYSPGARAVWMSRPHRLDNFHSPN